MVSASFPTLRPNPSNPSLKRSANGMSRSGHAELLNLDTLLYCHSLERIACLLTLTISPSSKG